MIGRGTLIVWLACGLAIGFMSARLAYKGDLRGHEPTGKVDEDVTFWLGGVRVDPRKTMPRTDGEVDMDCCIDCEGR